MAHITLPDSELVIMNVVWQAGGSISAKDAYAQIAENRATSRGTIYSLIHRLIDKGILTKEDPGFILKATVSKDDIRRESIRKLIDNLFGGSAKNLAVSLVEDGHITTDDIETLMEMARSVDET